MAAHAHNAMRLAYDDARDVVDEYEGDDVRVEELLGEAKVGPIRVHVGLQELLDKRLGLAVSSGCGRLRAEQQRARVVDVVALFAVLVLVDDELTLAFQLVVALRRRMLMSSVLSRRRGAAVSEQLLLAALARGALLQAAEFASHRCLAPLAQHQRQELAEHVVGDEAQDAVEDELLVHDVVVEDGVVDGQQPVGKHRRRRRRRCARTIAATHRAPSWKRKRKRRRVGDPALQLVEELQLPLDVHELVVTFLSRQQAARCCCRRHH